MGVYKIRFTGGEPLLRKDLPKLVKFANQISLIQSVHLTTNGLLLGKYINDLEQAGLTGINISLDTLKAERFKTITRREGLDIVMDGIEKAIKSNIPSVKINIVAMRDFNHDELMEFAALTKDNDVTVVVSDVCVVIPQTIAGATGELIVLRTLEAMMDANVINAGDIQKAIEHILV